MFFEGSSSDFANKLDHLLLTFQVVWVEMAEQGPVAELRTFAVGIRQEYKAGAASLEYPWSKGPVEGQVNRVKTLTRQL
jgi:transposase